MSAYRPDVDGLRAVAILMVVAYHIDLAAGGFIGVDVFFVISGFVIVRGLARELAESGRISWLGFFSRRVRRLVPAAVLMLLATLALGWLLLDPLGEEQALARGAIAAATSTSNFYFLDVQPTDYFTVRPDAQVYLHTWSLAVEEQFYLALPLVVGLAWLIGRRHTGRGLPLTLAVISLTSLAAAIWLAQTNPPAGFFLPVSRGYELGIGALLALVPLPRPGRHGPWFATACAVVLGGLFVVALPRDQFPGAWGLVPALATAGLIWAGSDGATNRVSRLLATRPAVVVGTLSYGWYLWHWPLLAIATGWNLRLLSLPERIAVVMVALGVAWLSHRFVEQRFRRPRVRQTRPLRARAIVSAVASLALVAGAAVSLRADADRAGRTPQWTAVSNVVKDDVDLPEACAADQQDREKPGVPCAFNDYVPRAPTVVVWGDSHARMYLPAVAEAAQRAGRHVNVVGWTLAQCPPYLPADPAAGSLSAPRETLDLCVAHNAAAVQWIDQHPAPTRVVLAARWPMYRQQAPDTRERSAAQLATIAAMQGRIASATGPLLEQLAAHGVGADVVSALPTLFRPAPYCLARSAWPFDCNVPRASVDLQLRDSTAWLSQLLATSPRGTRLIDVEPLVCGEQWCFAKRANKTLFHDSNHLTKGTSQRAGDYFAATIAAALRAS